MANKSTVALMDKDLQTMKMPDFVDDKSFYNITIQVGARFSWRTYHGKKREVRIDPATGKPVAVHAPKIFEAIGPFDGATVNGLIQEQKDWYDAWRRRDKDSSKGHLDLQILVLSTQQTTELPADLKKKQSPELLSLIEAVVKKYVGQVVPAAKQP
jgi:hypothetical protein